MSFTHTNSFNWSGGGNNTVTKAVALSAGGEVNVDDTIATGQTNKAVAFALDISQLKSIYIVSDVAITLKTNDGSSPQESFTLTADYPLVWYLGCGLAVSALFAGDVTGLFVTNASGSTCNLKVRALTDPTI